MHGVALFVLASAIALTIEQQAVEIMQSVEFAQIVSAADVCGYQIDDAALETFMSDRVAALHDQARFNYYAVTTTFPDELKEMTDTARKASCALQATIAKRHGLTP